MCFYVRLAIPAMYVTISAPCVRWIISEYAVIREEFVGKAKRDPAN